MQNPPEAQNPEAEAKGENPNEAPVQETSHIVSAFDRDIEAIQTTIMQMGGMVEKAISDVLQGLKNTDTDLIRATCENDKKIDALDDTLNTKIAQIIALRAPAAGDLRILLSVLKMSSNLERIGDYAKNIGHRGLIISAHTPIPGAIDGIIRMAGEVLELLRNVLDAYAQSNIELAEKMREYDAYIDQIYTSLFREIISHMLENPGNITTCIHLHFIVKNIERMGDHATNICEHIIYMITGEAPSHDRKKIPPFDIDDATKD